MILEAYLLTLAESYAESVGCVDVKCVCVRRRKEDYRWRGRSVIARRNLETMGPENLWERAKELLEVTSP